MSDNKPPSGKTKDEIAEAYDSTPWWYDIRGFFILTFAYNSSINSQLRLFSPNFGERHLEVACGTGTLLELILKWRKLKKLPESQIVGVDYAEPMLAGARKRFANNSNIELCHADVGELPYPDNSFDTANVANAIHCFPDVDAALAGIHRVLKPGGSIAANVLLYPRTPQPLKAIAERINNWGIRKGILYTPYKQEDIRNRIINCGFEITSESVSGNCYNIIACKLKT